MSLKLSRLRAAASLSGTAVLLAVLGASLSRPTAAAVFGSDERVPLPQSLRAVGDKIGVLHDPRSHSVCTAFCVGRDIVATAAHCLYRTSDVSPLRLTDLLLKLHGSHTSTHIAGAAEGTPETNVIAGSTRLNVHPPIDATRDWALVRLANPVCKAGSFKLSRKPVEEVMRLAEAGRVYNVAYHRDLPKWQPMFEFGLHGQTQLRGRGVEHDQPRFRQPRAAPAAHLRHGRRLVGLATAR